MKISKRDTVALSNKASDVMKSIVELIENGKKLSQAEEILGIKGIVFKATTGDKDLKKIESHLAQVLKILEQMKTIAQSYRAIELSEVSQRICNLLKEIGAKNPRFIQPD